jgi:3-oxoadipate enol-lactonase/4-carboxymuconolactone decarboxylase
MPDPSVELVRSLDGTFVAARALSETGDGLPVLVANAVGADLSLWHRALTDVARSSPVVTWDHRGLGESGAPASSRMDPEAHADDALAVLDHFELDQAVVVAWSNGGRIALELAASSPHRVAGLVLVCAGYGQPLERFARNLEPSALLPAVAALARLGAPVLEPVYRAAVARPELAGVLRQTGLIAPTADSDALAALLRSIGTNDFRRLLTAYAQLAGRAEDGILARVTAPALVVAGGRDRIATPAMMQEVADGLSDARFELYAEATHLLPIELPARLSDDLRAFLATLD